MHAVIETARPFEASILWRLHDSYFAQRGHRAWQHGDIPWFSTNNEAFAAQHAGLLVAIATELRAAGVLGPDEPVRVVEGGCGTGLFAANFVRSFEAAAPPGMRLCYVITDASEVNVREAAASHYLAPSVAAGTVLPATLDLRDPGSLHLLDGEPFEGRVAMFINNYVCCVIPMVHLQRDAEGRWARLCVDVSGEVDGLEDAAAIANFLARNATRHGLIKDLAIDWRWVPTELEAALDDDLHREVVVAALEGLGAATVGYPRGYLDFMRGVAPLLVPGGVILTNDYGSVDLRRLGGARDWRPQFYGNTFNQDVNLGLLAAFARRLGWDAALTPCDLGSVHAALLAPGGLGPEAQAAFTARYGRVSGSDMLLDFSQAAKHFQQKKETGRALRFFLLCADLDPHNAEHRFRVGETAIDAGLHALAVEHLRRGFELDVARAWDFEFQLGRAYCLLDDNAAALAWYERSQARAPHAVTLANMGMIHAAEGRHREAWLHFSQALELDPTYARAAERMDALKEAIWAETTAAFARETAASEARDATSR
jgi:hypothetical protein